MSPRSQSSLKCKMMCHFYNEVFNVNCIDRSINVNVTWARLGYVRSVCRRTRPYERSHELPATIAEHENVRRVYGRTSMFP